MAQTYPPLTTFSFPKYRRSPHNHNGLLTLLAAGDFVLAFLGLSLGFWIRFYTPVKDLGIEVRDPSYWSYFNLMVVGSVLLVSTYAYLGLYNWRYLLRPWKTMAIIGQGTVFWFFVYLGVSLALKFEPAISRIFVLVSMVTVLAAVLGWRFLVYEFLTRLNYSERLSQRVGILGWTEEGMNLMHTINADTRHPYQVVGLVLSPLDTPEKHGPLRDVFPILGRTEDLEAVVHQHALDILVVTDMDLSRETLLQINATCERLYVDLKITPTFFQIFVSGLQLQTISGVPILGVEELAITRPFNQLIKRCIDIVGALVGLCLFSPLMLYFAWRILRENPGPVLFKQERVGQDSKPFKMLKLRSMKSGSEKLDHLNQSTLREDPRLLKCGSFMRKWNIDEMPQFWNVLVGDMSLVGPRPERTFHAQKLSSEIAHYNPRHRVKPGITGWAQVNGLRGDTNLVERVKYDLYYIENWSVWMDVQIMVLTFFRRENAY